jgi:hypothetical protein
MIACIRGPGPPHRGVVAGCFDHPPARKVRGPEHRGYTFFVFLTADGRLTFAVGVTSIEEALRPVV